MYECLAGQGAASDTEGMRMEQSPSEVHDGHFCRGCFLGYCDGAVASFEACTYKALCGYTLISSSRENVEREAVTMEPASFPCGCGWSDT